MIPAGEMPSWEVAAPATEGMDPSVAEQNGHHQPCLSHVNSCQGKFIAYLNLSTMGQGGYSAYLTVNMGRLCYGTKNSVTEDRNMTHQKQWLSASERLDHNRSGQYEYDLSKLAMILGRQSLSISAMNRSMARVIGLLPSFQEWRIKS